MNGCFVVSESALNTTRRRVLDLVILEVLLRAAGETISHQLGFGMNTNSALSFISLFLERAPICILIRIR